MFWYPCLVNLQVHSHRKKTRKMGFRKMTPFQQKDWKSIFCKASFFGASMISFSGFSVIKHPRRWATLMRVFCSHVSMPWMYFWWWFVELRKFESAGWKSPFCSSPFRHLFWNFLFNPFEQYLRRRTCGDLPCFEPGWWQTPPIESSLVKL